MLTQIRVDEAPVSSQRFAMSALGRFARAFVLPSDIKLPAMIPGRFRSRCVIAGSNSSAPAISHRAVQLSDDTKVISYFRNSATSQGSS